MLASDLVHMSRRRWAGMVLLLAGVQFTLLLIVAESQYPGYNAGANVISDLGVWSEPSAIIFNPSVIAFGALAVIAAYLIKDEADMCHIPILMALSGVGAIGVGLFPETTHLPHVVSAGIAFGVGGIACVNCYRIVKSPLNYLLLGLGLLGLIALVLTGMKIDVGIGIGGIERMVAYPIIIWILMMGAILANGPDEASSCSCKN